MTAHRLTARLPFLRRLAGSQAEIVRDRERCLPSGAVEMVPLAEIGSELGITAGAVKNELHRARQRLTFRRDRRGAVAVEMALMLPVFLLLAIGLLDVANLMLNDLELAFVTNNAATVQAQAHARDSTAGVVWGQSQIPAATFAASSGTCGGTPAAVITASWPYQGLILGITLSHTACAPTTDGS